VPWQCGCWGGHRRFRSGLLGQFFQEIHESIQISPHEGHRELEAALEERHAIPVVLAVEIVPSEMTEPHELVQVPVGAVRVTGSAAKGVSFEGLRFGPDEQGRWRCRATVDV